MYIITGIFRFLITLANQKSLTQAHLVLIAKIKNTCVITSKMYLIADPTTSYKIF